MLNSKRNSPFCLGRESQVQSPILLGIWIACQVKSIAFNIGKLLIVCSTKYCNASRMSIILLSHRVSVILLSTWPKIYFPHLMEYVYELMSMLMLNKQSRFSLASLEYILTTGKSYNPCYCYYYHYQLSVRLLMRLKVRISYIYVYERLADVSGDLKLNIPLSHKSGKLYWNPLFI